MELFYNILAVLGVAGLISVGIWVGVIQTKVSRHENTEASAKAGQDFLAGKISGQGEMLAQVKSDVASVMAAHGALAADVRADHDLLIRLDEKVNLILQRLEAARS